jgi:hypothetical protein
MADLILALPPVVAAILAGLAAAGVYVLILWLCAQVSRHRRRPKPPPRTVPGLDLLELPVRLPGGTYPDTWTDYPDALNAHLAELCDQLWPGEEYMAILTCPHPALTDYATAADAALAADRSRRSRISACLCGAFHIRYRRAGRTRPAPPPTPSSTVTPLEEP